MNEPASMTLGLPEINATGLLADIDAGNHLQRLKIEDFYSSRFGGNSLHCDKRVAIIGRNGDAVDDFAFSGGPRELLTGRGIEYGNGRITPIGGDKPSIPRCCEVVNTRTRRDAAHESPFFKINFHNLA